MQSIHRRGWLAAIGLFIAPGVLLATTAWADERVFDKKFAVSPGGTLTVETESGSVAVAGADTNEVVVHAVLRGGRGPVEKYQITAENNADGVQVHGRRTTQWWFDWSHIFGGGFNVRYTIQVPRNYHVQIRTSGGDVELREFNGKVFSRTSGGNVTVSAVNGEVQIQSSGGNMHATQLIGDVRVGTSGGDVKLDNVRGSVEARTSGGDVRLTRIDGKVSARTSGGDVNVEVIGVNRGIELRTSGGDVTVSVPKQFAAQINAHTSGGDVACDLPVTLATPKVDKHHRTLDGAINGGGAPLSVHTSGGDIRIRAQST